MDDQIKNLAPKIWAEIKQANKILINCHYNPDQDSIGSALAMMHILENIGKEVTVIKGDSDLPAFAQYLPGAEKIALKNYFEIKPEEFDLFVILDSSDLGRVSRVGEIIFPPNLRTVVIDHHASNTQFGQLNLIVTDYPATAQVLFDLSTEWGVEITRDIAVCLIVALHADTGGFRYRKTSSHTFNIASRLAAIAPDFADTLANTEGSKSLATYKFMGATLSRLEEFFDGQVVIAATPYQDFQKFDFSISESKNTGLSSMLINIKGVKMSFLLNEEKPGVTGMSARSRDGKKYDVAALMAKFGGGGHQVAAGAMVNKPLAEVKADLIAALTEMLQ
ncbi:MAG: hypothetical protein A2114_01970 [Candidatus Vogelbacteria bacterium GWA1_51_14]|uniref:DDH domain-containing protein n=1 Tax=Candidatus Vogelbacteria bacterium GWA1_51_14 TaxID=1802435 RepID=A0A1G2QCD5_9BACT|nr:MAG: hypothetical protein A2114_01970 [Candidatus Vogelbacteria bacterium GWA1_51_14]